MSSTPTKTAMAPAVCRMMEPKPRASSPSRARYSPPPATARRTPGCPMVACGLRHQSASVR